MRVYSVNDILAALHINKHRLVKLTDHLDIRGKPSLHDKRLRTFSEDEYKRIKMQHEEWLAERGISDADSLESLRAQLDSAQREISRLKSERMQNTSLDTEATPARPQTHRSGFVAHREEVPAGYVRTEKFAEDHGVPKATAWGHIDKGKFAETTEKIQNRNGVYHFLSPEQQIAAIGYWRIHYSRYHVCEDAGCVCHQG